MGLKLKKIEQHNLLLTDLKFTNTEDLFHRIKDKRSSIVLDDRYNCFIYRYCDGDGNLDLERGLFYNDNTDEDFYSDKYEKIKRIDTQPYFRRYFGTDGIAVVVKYVKDDFGFGFKDIYNYMDKNLNIILDDWIDKPYIFPFYNGVAMIDGYKLGKGTFIIMNTKYEFLDEKEIGGLNIKGCYFTETNNIGYCLKDDKNVYYQIVDE